MAIRKEVADILLRVSCRTVVHAPRRFYFLLACRPDAMSRRLFSCYRHYSGNLTSGNIGLTLSKAYSIRFLKDILGQGIDVINSIKNMLEGYDALFPANDKHRNEILIKRILLHYKDANGQTFWRQTSPYYDRNYETSSWKKIIRCDAFLIFYNEISRRYTYGFSEQDLVSLIEKKQNEFYSDNSNRVFNAKKWSDRRLAIFFDTITEGRLWSQNNYPDLGFYESTNNEAKAFIGKTRIGNRICGRKNQWQMKEFPANWGWHLQNMFRYYDFHFD